MNIIRNQSDAAIKLDYASFNTISANRIWSCRTGIQLMGGSTYNNIQANQISYGQCGMGLSAFSSDLVYYDTACNVIIQNTIFKNACGMTLDNSKSNTIFENKFIQNAVQISLHESFDIWHDEKNEGNYWSDYSGRDLNDDGIGDTQLPHQGVDNYPLMKPCLNTTVDVNTDGKVNIQDIVVLSSIYGCRPDDPRWNWNADIAFPYGVIDILDLVVCAAHYGELTAKS
jgi:parallel beta-helix repeat protein